MASYVTATGFVFCPNHSFFLVETAFKSSSQQLQVLFETPPDGIALNAWHCFVNVFLIFKIRMIFFAK